MSSLSPYTSMKMSTCFWRSCCDRVNMTCSRRRRRVRFGRVTPRFAVSQGRAIVTHNRDDYAELARVYAEAGQQHFGIILAVRRSPYEIARRLMMILDQVTS